MGKLETPFPNAAWFAKALTLLILLIIHATPAFAYLDPGTGSILLQGIIASIAAILAAGGIFWHRIKVFFSSLFSSADSSTADSETEKSD